MSSKLFAKTAAVAAVIGAALATGWSLAPAADAAPAPAVRIVVHHDVLPLEDRLVVAAPLLEERFAALLLDLVVGDLGRGRRLHRR